MAKIRIHELAKELDVPSKDIIEYLTKEGVEASNHMSSIEESDAARARAKFSNKTQPEKKAAAAPRAEKKTEAKVQPAKKPAEYRRPSV